MAVNILGIVWNSGDQFASAAARKIFTERPRRHIPRRLDRLIGRFYQRRWDPMRTRNPGHAVLSGTGQSEPAAGEAPAFGVHRPRCILLSVWAERDEIIGTSRASRHPRDSLSTKRLPSSRGCWKPERQGAPHSVVLCPRGSALSPQTLETLSETGGVLSFPQVSRSVQQGFQEPRWRAFAAAGLQRGSGGLNASWGHSWAF
jgi:hypothetical protein